MNDMEKLQNLLDSWGVPYTKDRSSEGWVLVVGNFFGPGSGKVDGYLGFYTAFHFDDGGKFIRMGAWD